MSAEQQAHRASGPRGPLWLRRHVIAYVAVIGCSSVINIIDGAPWWAFWPTAVWGTVLMIHFFIVKAMTIDESWANERALDLREHSYDFDHMKDIERRIVEDDFSVRPGSEQRAVKDE